eukprot:s2822_g5.t1
MSLLRPAVARLQAGSRRGWQWELVECRDKESSEGHDHRSLRRFCHASWRMGGMIFVLGGLDHSNPTKPVSDMEVLDICDECDDLEASWQITLVQLLAEAELTTSELPATRLKASFEVVPETDFQRRSPGRDYGKKSTEAFAFLFHGDSSENLISVRVLKSMRAAGTSQDTAGSRAR